MCGKKVFVLPNPALIFSLIQKIPLFTYFFSEAFSIDLSPKDALSSRTSELRGRPC